MSNSITDHLMHRLCVNDFNQFSNVTNISFVCFDDKFEILPLYKQIVYTFILFETLNCDAQMTNEVINRRWLLFHLLSIRWSSISFKSFLSKCCCTSKKRLADRLRVGSWMTYKFPSQSTKMHFMTNLCATE